MFTSLDPDSNIIELATILSSSDIVTLLPRYDSNQISNFIANDIKRALQVYRFDELIAEKNSTIHLIHDQVHSINGNQKSVLDSTNSLVENDIPDITQISPISPSIVLRQITNNKIGFDFLTNTQLSSFLIAVVSTIDRSYQLTDLSESLSLFSQLVIAQSMSILRSCSNSQEHNSSNQPCLIVSTLFLRPVIENDKVFSIYRLIPLPANINGEQFIYSNIPEAIGINTDDQTVILWDSVPKKNECLFSLFIYCQKKPPFIQLSNLPCLSQLLNDDTHIINSCHVTPSRKTQTGIMNIESNIWIFSLIEEPLYCQLRSHADDFNGIIVIKEPSIVRMPCGNTIKCTNIELPPSICNNRSVLIKSTATGKYEKLSTIPWSIENMTEQLISNYKITIKNSLKNIINDLMDNRLTFKTILKEFGALTLSIIFLLFLSLILFFVRWVKRLVLKRMDKLEKDHDDLAHEFFEVVKKLNIFNH